MALIRKHPSIRAIGLLAAVGLAMTASACGSSASSAGSTTSAQTAAGSAVSGDISFYAVVNDNYTKAFWGEQIANFEKSYPGVKVKLLDSAGQDYDGYAKTLLASGQFPDVAHNLTVSDYSKQGLLKAYDIDDKVKQLRGVDQLTQDGKLYFLPTAVQPQSLVYYNKDDFAAAGITQPPATLGELDSDMGKLKAAGKVPMLVSGEWTTGFQYGILSQPTVFGAQPKWFGARASGSAKFATSGWADTADLFASWAKQGYFGKGALSRTYDSGLKDFIAGKASMYPMGVWFTANAATTPPKFNLGVFAAPSKDGKPTLAVTYGLKYTVSAKSKSPAAATAFAEFMATDRTVVAATLKADGLLSNANPPVTYEQTPLQTEVSKIVQSATLVPNDGTGDTPPVKGLSDELNQVAQSIILGQTSGGKAVATLDTWWDSNS